MTKLCIISIAFILIFAMKQTAHSFVLNSEQSLGETVEFENNEHFDLLDGVFKRETNHNTDNNDDDLDKAEDNPFDPRHFDDDEEVSSIDREKTSDEELETDNGRETVVGERLRAGNVVPKEDPEWNSGIKDDAFDVTQSKHDIGDWAPEAILDIAYFLRDHKFNDYDRRIRFSPFESKMFSQLQEVFKATGGTDNVGTNSAVLSENCLKKLTSLSRFVTPCPDILDGQSSSNKTVYNKVSSSISNMNTSPSAHGTQYSIYNQSREESSDCFHFPEPSEFSESSDESAWESVQTPTHLGGQWKNLLEYEASLQAKKDRQFMDAGSQSQEPRNSLLSSKVPHQNTTEKTVISQEDIVEILKSIAKSLQLLQANSCGSVTDRFGKYIAHALSELSAENRSEAEIEINKVLVKYLARELQAKSSSPLPKEDTSDEVAEWWVLKDKPEI